MDFVLVLSLVKDSGTFGVLKFGEVFSTLLGFLDLKNLFGVSSWTWIFGKFLAVLTANSSMSLGFLGFRLDFNTGVFTSTSSLASVDPFSVVLINDRIESRLLAKFSGSPTPRDDVTHFFGVPGKVIIIKRCFRSIYKL